MRVLLVEIVAGHFEHAGAVEKMLTDRPHELLLRTVDALLEIEQQDLVKLGHCLGGPVVAAHQRFRGALPIGRGVAKALGHGGLQVEHEAVLAAARDHMQFGANQREQTFVALQLAALKRSDQTLVGKRLPGLAQMRGARDPDQHLQVAQAAGAFFAVGLERVRRVFVLGMTLTHFQRLGAQEGACVHRLGELALEAPVERLLAGEQARFEQRGLHGHVASSFAQAFAQCAN